MAVEHHSTVTCAVSREPRVQLIRHTVHQFFNETSIASSRRLAPTASRTEAAARPLSSSSMMSRCSPALLLIASCGAARASVDLNGVYFSFRTGGSPSDVVDRFEARQSSDSSVTFYRNTQVGQTTQIDTSSAHAMESYRIDGTTLRGAVTATVQPSGDIVWSHGYTSRKEAGLQACTAATHDASKCLDDDCCVDHHHCAPLALDPTTLAPSPLVLAPLAHTEVIRVLLRSESCQQLLRVSDGFQPTKGPACWPGCSTCF